MEDPKNLEELNSLLDKRKKDWKKSYQIRKWLSIFTGYSWGLGMYGPEINKDKKFWIAVLAVMLLLAFISWIFFIIYGDRPIFS